MFNYIEKDSTRIIIPEDKYFTRMRNNLELITEFREIEPYLPIGYLYKDINQLDDKYLIYGAGKEGVSLKISLELMSVILSFAKSQRMTYRICKEKYKDNKIRIGQAPLFNDNKRIIEFKMKTNGNIYDDCRNIISLVSRVYSSIIHDLCSL